MFPYILPSGTTSGNTTLPGQRGGPREPRKTTRGVDRSGATRQQATKEQPARTGGQRPGLRQTPDRLYSMLSVSRGSPRVRVGRVGWYVKRLVSRVLAFPIWFGLLVAGRSYQRRSQTKALQVLHVYPRRCAQCRYFDHERGQEVLRANPAFAEATKFLTPAQMGETAKARVSPEGEFADQANRDGQFSRWKDFGACGKHSMAVDPNYVCKDWK